MTINRAQRTTNQDLHERRSYLQRPRIFTSTRRDTGPRLIGSGNGVAPLVYGNARHCALSPVHCTVLAPLGATRLRCTSFLPLSACTPNSQRLWSQKAPLPTPNRRRSNNCNLCALSCGADQYMPMYRLRICAPQALPPLRPAANRTHTLVVSASRCARMPRYNTKL